MKRFKEFLNEGFNSNVKGKQRYWYAENIMDDFFKGIITAKQVKTYGKKLGKGIGEKSEIQDFLKNKFMIGVKAEEMNVSEKDIIKRAKQLLKVM